MRVHDNDVHQETSEWQALTASDRRGAATTAARLVAPRTLDDYFQAAYDNDDDVDHAATKQPHFVSFKLACPSQWRYMLLVTALGISSAADAAEMFSIGYVLGDAAFQHDILQNDLKRGGAWISGILSLGLILGGLTAGSSEGRAAAGRKYLLLVGLGITSLAGMACALVPPVTGLVWMVLFRFIAGLGIGAILASTAPLATELSPPRERGFVVSVANSFWTVGLIFNAIWAYIVFGWFEASWRIYMVISTLPSVLGFGLILVLVPESPRFLAVQGRFNQAALSANRVALALGYRGPMLQASEIEHHYANNVIISGSSQNGHHPPYSFRDKIRHGVHQVRSVYHKNNWKPILIVQILWIAASVGGSIGQWINVIFHKIKVQNIYLCFIFLNCTCIPGNIACAMLTDRIGRTKFFSGSMFVAGAALLGVAFIVANGTTDADDTTAVGDNNLGNRTRSILFCTSFFYASMTGLYSCLYVMAAELFPTHVRSTGVALCSTFGRVASVFAMFMNGALVETPAVLLFVGSSILLLGFVLSVAFPPNEMKLKPVADNGNESDDNGEERGEEDSQPEPMITQAIYQRKSSELKYFGG